MNLENYDEIEEKVTFLKGQESCAAGPWVYRTDTGDEHGKVVESAELPEKKGKKLFRLDYIETDGRDYIEVGEVWIIGSNDGDFKRFESPDASRIYTDDWLRKHLIAWAEIRK